MLAGSIKPPLQIYGQVQALQQQSESPRRRPAASSPALCCLIRSLDYYLVLNPTPAQMSCVFFKKNYAPEAGSGFSDRPQSEQPSWRLLTAGAGPAAAAAAAQTPATASCRPHPEPPPLCCLQVPEKDIRGWTKQFGATTTWSFKYGRLLADPIWGCVQQHNT